ncbi:MAG: hypothetical protein KGI33_12345 [Thaumarchaeota archaeon]|nr:hypothetical protein [Nitrososphaerota archaeon]
MNLLDDIITMVSDVLTFRMYDVTIIIERDGLLIEKKTYKQLLTLRQIEKMIK